MNNPRFISLFFLSLTIGCGGSAAETSPGGGAALQNFDDIVLPPSPHKVVLVLTVPVDLTGDEQLRRVRPDLLKAIMRRAEKLQYVAPTFFYRWPMFEVISGKSELRLRNKNFDLVGRQTFQNDTLIWPIVNPIFPWMTRQTPPPTIVVKSPEQDSEDACEQNQQRGTPTVCVQLSMSVSEKKPAVAAKTIPESLAQALSSVDKNPQQRTIQIKVEHVSHEGQVPRRCTDSFAVEKDAPNSLILEKVVDFVASCSVAIVVTTTDPDIGLANHYQLIDQAGTLDQQSKILLAAEQYVLYARERRTGEQGYDRLSGALELIEGSIEPNPNRSSGRLVTPFSQYLMLHMYITLGINHGAYKKVKISPAMIEQVFGAEPFSSPAAQWTKGLALEVMHNSVSAHQSKSENVARSLQKADAVWAAIIKNATYPTMFGKEHASRANLKARNREAASHRRELRFSDALKIHLDIKRQAKNLPDVSPDSWLIRGSILLEEAADYLTLYALSSSDLRTIMLRRNLSEYLNTKFRYYRDQIDKYEAIAAENKGVVCGLFDSDTWREISAKLADPVLSCHSISECTTLREQVSAYLDYIETAALKCSLITLESAYRDLDKALNLACEEAVADNSKCPSRGRKIRAVKMPNPAMNEIVDEVYSTLAHIAMSVRLMHCKSNIDMDLTLENTQRFRQDQGTLIGAQQTLKEVYSSVELSCSLTDLADGDMDSMQWILRWVVDPPDSAKAREASNTLSGTEGVNTEMLRMLLDYAFYAPPLRSYTAWLADASLAKVEKEHCRNRIRSFLESGAKTEEQARMLWSTCVASVRQFDCSGQGIDSTSDTKYPEASLGHIVSRLDDAWLHARTRSDHLEDKATREKQRSLQRTACDKLHDFVDWISVEGEATNDNVTRRLRHARRSLVADIENRLEMVMHSFVDTIIFHIKVRTNEYARRKWDSTIAEKMGQARKIVSDIRSGNLASALVGVADTEILSWVRGPEDDPEEWGIIATYQAVVQWKRTFLKKLNNAFIQYSKETKGLFIYRLILMKILLHAHRANLGVWERHRADGFRYALGEWICASWTERKHLCNVSQGRLSFLRGWMRNKTDKKIKKIRRLRTELATNYRCSSYSKAPRQGRNTCIKRFLANSGLQKSLFSLSEYADFVRKEARSASAIFSQWQNAENGPMNSLLAFWWFLQDGKIPRGRGKKVLRILQSEKFLAKALEHPKKLARDFGIELKSDVPFCAGMAFDRVLSQK